MAMNTKNKPKQRRQALAENTEDLNRIDRTLSATYLLITMAEYNLLDAEEILSKYGLVAFDLKHQLNTIHNAFDKIDARFRQIINKGSVEDYMNDLDNLQKIIDEYIKNEHKK